jgi:hypothetical protein
MKCTMLIYRPRERKPHVLNFSTEPSVPEMEAILGGEIKRVPGFLSIEHQGVVHRCVALCAANSTGKRPPLNVAATILWDLALRRDMGIGLMTRNGTRADELAGPVAILFAD